MKNILKALAEFQQEVPIIHKNAKGYGYTYTDLATIIETIKPLLKKHNLGFYQITNENSLITVLFHIESGETISSEALLPVSNLIYEVRKNKEGNDIDKILGFDGMNTAQAYGSMITYFRRYELTNVLGLVTSNDADAINKRIEKENTPLPELKQGDKNWQGVIKAMKEGYEIEQIRKKYTVSKETEKLLQNETV